MKAQDASRSCPLTRGEIGKRVPEAVGPNSPCHERSALDLGLFVVLICTSVWEFMPAFSLHHTSCLQCCTVLVLKDSLLLPLPNKSPWSVFPSFTASFLFLYDVACYCITSQRKHCSLAGGALASPSPRQWLDSTRRFKVPSTWVLATLIQRLHLACCPPRTFRTRQVTGDWLGVFCPLCLPSPPQAPLHLTDLEMTPRGGVGMVECTWQLSFPR